MEILFPLNYFASDYVRGRVIQSGAAGALQRILLGLGLGGFFGKYSGASSECLLIKKLEFVVEARIAT